MAQPEDHHLYFVHLLFIANNTGYMARHSSIAIVYRVPMWSTAAMSYYSTLSCLMCFHFSQSQVHQSSLYICTPDASGSMVRASRPWELVSREGEEREVLRAVGMRTWRNAECSKFLHSQWRTSALSCSWCLSFLWFLGSPSSSFCFIACVIFDSRMENNNSSVGSDGESGRGTKDCVRAVGMKTSRKD